MLQPTSVKRPLLFLTAVCVAFAALYASFSDSAILWLPGRIVDWSQTLRWLSYSILNALPLAGLDHASKGLYETLFPKGPSPWLSIVLVFHKVLSLILLFLIGLALRNLFKMK
jgi:hypothetical protein